MTIGARVLKTGIAVALAIFMSGMIGFASPIIAAVAAIFTIQPSVYRSWQQVLDQVQSNVLGAAVALLAVRLLGSTPIAIGIVCVGVILINIRLRMENAIGLTLVTVVAVMDAHSTGWEFALERFSMVMTGMACAFIVNVLLFPPRPKKQFTEQVHAAYDLLSLLLRTAISNEMKEQVHRESRDQLGDMLAKLDERYKLFEEERAIRQVRKLERARQLILSQQMIKALRKGADLLEVVQEHYFAVPEAGEWAHRFDRQIEELTKYHENILLKSEGKTKPGVQLEPNDGKDDPFAQDLATYLTQDMSERKRLVFVASALFEYNYHLRRLDKLLEQVKEREQ